MHGVKILVYSLPNGLAGATFGPVSHRRNDNRVVDCSGIDAFLLAFQLSIVFLADKVYSFYCDDGFGSLWSCLRTRHRPLLGGQMSARQIAENKVMKKVRESIEWSFGSVKSHWKMSERWDLFQIDREPTMVYSQIRVMHLLQNCYTCLRGNAISGRHVFHLCASYS
jgi:hypothetical protein